MRHRLRLPIVACGPRIQCGCRPAEATNRRAEAASRDVEPAEAVLHALNCPRACSPPQSPPFLPPTRTRVAIAAAASSMHGWSTQLATRMTEARISTGANVMW